MHMNHEMPYRELGRTGEKVSIIGVGGYHLGIPDNPADAIGIVRGAIDRGVNFLDCSWDYWTIASNIAYALPPHAESHA
ncbi:hypothetical protein [Methanoculleus bourgensis]|uniref:hypothetical protein n=1 Tax=Methanoculleus bourgensis TaxID=83986 RepID=UPI002493920E|nr:hypothetical protein [Methanoculleus bourgensis]